MTRLTNEIRAARIFIISFFVAMLLLYGVVWFIVWQPFPWFPKDHDMASFFRLMLLTFGFLVAGSVLAVCEDD